MFDKEVEAAIKAEKNRQKNNIELIASENYVSDEVLEAVGSCLTNKYAEGYPGKRYYGGCQNVDIVEDLARDRACKLFNAEHANVQPHSGSQANMAVYRSVLEPGDRLLGMSLDAGGHLTHGYKLSFSGQTYDCFSYGVDKETELIDYAEVRRLALYLRPKMIVAGASAYARLIDYKKFKEIADEVGAYLMVDMAHIAGMVAVGLIPSPVPYADFVTTTTHKTLRGPRGGMILCKKEYAEKLDKALFPGIQGGPLCHVVAGKAVCLYEAMQPSFREYQKQILANATQLANTLKKEGFRLVSGGTDNHLVLVDVKKTTGLTGKQLEILLDKVNITVNKNSIPFDQEKPLQTSGIRLGTPAMTTRGFKEAEFDEVGMLISKIAHHPEDERVFQEVLHKVSELTSKF